MVGTLLAGIAAHSISARADSITVSDADGFFTTTTVVTDPEAVTDPQWMAEPQPIPPPAADPIEVPLQGYGPDAPDDGTAFISSGKAEWKPPAEKRRGEKWTPLTANSYRGLTMGGIPDCWFVASIVSVAKQNPQAINDRIKPNADGTYHVSLAGYDPVDVDPLDNGNNITVAILEAAAVRVGIALNGYEKRMGWGKGIEVLTGHSTSVETNTTYSTNGFNPNIGRPAHKIILDEIQNKAKAGILCTGPAALRPSKELPSYLTDGHCYAVIGFREDRGEAVLLNPQDPSTEKLLDWADITLKGYFVGFVYED